MHPDDPTSDGGLAASAPAAARRLLAVSGWQASGKTTLLAGAIRELRARGLGVAVVKHDAHGIRLDVEGKDSDRLFRAGADVTLDGSEERFERMQPEDREPIEVLLERLERRYDLVLVEGYKALSIPRVWLLGSDHEPPPPTLSGLVATLPARDADERFLALVLERLTSAWTRTPVRVGVFASAEGAGELADSTRRALVEAGAASVVALGTGAGALPLAPGARGELGALRTALRWDPDAAWILLPHDAAARAAACVRWIIARRRPGCWAILPRVDGHPRSLCALFEPQSAEPLAVLASAGEHAPAELAQHSRADSPSPPASLLSCWE